MPRLEIVSFGAMQWTKRLERTGYAAGHAKMFFETEVIPDMERIEYQLFMSGGRRGGGSWRGLRPETIATKLRKNQDPRINIATGNLLGSLTEKRHKDAVRVVTNSRLRFGSIAPGAKQSQEHRPIVRFTKFDRARWARWWAAYIVRIGRA